MPPRLGRRLIIVYPGICLTNEENHGKPIRVAEKCTADQRWTRLVWSTWPSRAMASTGLLASAALGVRLKRRGQLSVSVGICRVAVQRGSPRQLTLSPGSLSGLWCGRETAEHPGPRLSACYVPGATVARRRHVDCNTCNSGHGSEERTSKRGMHSPLRGGWAAYISGLRSWRRDPSSYSGRDPAYPSFA